MSDIDEIKSKLNIVDIVGARVALKKAGRNFKGLCPFHNEKTPSFMVSTDRQTWHCFGCGRGGSVFDFVMEYEHIDFVEALEDLAQMAGVKLTRRVGDTPQEKLKQQLYEINHLAAEFYHYILTKHTLGEKARLYLASRGVSDKSIQTFLLGYSPNSWEGLYRYLRKKGYDGALLEQAGLVLQGQGKGYYDRFRGRVMFTLKDHRGNVVGFSGRVLDPTAKEAKYINTSETPIYVKGNVLYGLDVTKGEIQKKNEAVIMEGELDVISSFQAGISNVVAIKGSALTEAHVLLLRRFCERLVFALDSDLAGDAASRRGIEIAEKAGFDMRVARLSGGKDPDEAARHDPVAFKKAIAAAVPVYDYFLSSAVARFDAKTAFGKKKISEEVLPVIARIQNPIVVAHYIKELATTIDVPQESIHESLRRLAKKLPVTGANKEELVVGPQRSRSETLEIYVLALLFAGKTIELFEELKEYVQIADFSYAPVVQILTALEQFIGTSTESIFLLKDFIDQLPTELVRTLDEALLWDLSAFDDDPERSAKEWMSTIRQLRYSILRGKIRAASARMSDAARAGLADPMVEQIQQEIKTLTTQLSALEKSAGV